MVTRPSCATMSSAPSLRTTDARSSMLAVPGGPIRRVVNLRTGPAPEMASAPASATRNLPADRLVSMTNPTAAPISATFWISRTLGSKSREKVSPVTASSKLLWSWISSTWPDSPEVFGSVISLVCALAAVARHRVTSTVSGSLDIVLYLRGIKPGRTTQQDPVSGSPTGVSSSQQRRPSTQIAGQASVGQRSIAATAKTDDRWGYGGGTT